MTSFYLSYLFKGTISKTVNSELLGYKTSTYEFALLGGGRHLAHKPPNTNQSLALCRVLFKSLEYRKTWPCSHGLRGLTGETGI